MAGHGVAPQQGALRALRGRSPGCGGLPGAPALQRPLLGEVRAAGTWGSRAGGGRKNDPLIFILFFFGKKHRSAGSRQPECRAACEWALCVPGTVPGLCHRNPRHSRKQPIRNSPCRGGGTERQRGWGCSQRHGREHPEGLYAAVPQPGTRGCSHSQDPSPSPAAATHQSPLTSQSRRDPRCPGSQPLLLHTRPLLLSEWGESPGSLVPGSLL